MKTSSRSSDSDLDHLLAALKSAPSVNTLEIWMYCTSPNLNSFNSDEKSGKWCIFREEGEIDDVWQAISTLVENEELLLAKCSTKLSQRLGPPRPYPYVICVYTQDWADDAELDRTLQVIRAAGIEGILKYKRCIETFAGIEGDFEFYRTSSP